MMVKSEIAPSLRPGMHAATFGGNPIAARAGIAYIEAVENDDLLEHGKKVGELFRARLEEMRKQCNLIRDIRVLGTMIGIELSVDGAPIVKACLERQLLINCTHGVVLRLLPALNISEQQIHEGCDILAEALSAIQASA